MNAKSQVKKFVKKQASPSKAKGIAERTTRVGTIRR